MTQSELSPWEAFGARLRRLRGRLTRETVAATTAISVSTLYRMERGLTSPHDRTLRTLLDLYGVRDPCQRDYLYELARGHRDTKWYDNPALPISMATSWNLEARAAMLRTYYVQFIPPLLQTPEYAQAVCSVASTAYDRTLPLADGIATILARQPVLDTATKLWVIIDESALLRNIGGPHVRLKQLDALIHAVKRPTVALQIAPLADAAYLPCTGPFSIYRSPSDRDGDVVASHSFTFDRLYTDPDDVEPYRRAFDLLAAVATRPGRHTLDLLQQRRAELATVLT